MLAELGDLGRDDEAADFLGVVYTLLDAGGGWKMALVKELNAAKIEFDATRAF